MHQHVSDAALYAAFFAGALLFVLKRAAMAVRSKTNPIASRREYLARNWDVLLVRMGLGLPLFWVWVHYDLTDLIKAQIGVSLPFDVKVGAMSSFMFGFLADSVLDWLATWENLPAWIRKEIPERNSGGTPGG